MKQLEFGAADPNKDEKRILGLLDYSVYYAVQLVEQSVQKRCLISCDLDCFVQ